MKQTLSFVGVLPSRLRNIKNLANIPIATLSSNCAEPPCGSIKDLTKFDHIMIYPANKIKLTDYMNLNCKISLRISEPYAWNRHHYNKIWIYRFKFHKIFLCQKKYMKYHNVIAMPLNASWVKNSDQLNFTTKNKLISIIASSKNFLPGHKLRHNIVKKIHCPKIAILGRGYLPFEKKETGLLSYYFSIVIENSQEIDYFTEKILDSFLCKTIPIYWGAPNIGDYFNLDGIIIFDTIKELQLILNVLTYDSYQKFLLAIEQNYQTAKKFSFKNILKRMEKKLLNAKNH